MDARCNEKSPPTGQVEGPDTDKTKPASTFDSVTVGYLPTKINSATSEILASLLDGELITASDSLKKASTMRLAAVIKRLKSEYLWNVLSEPRAVGCTDGRLVRRIARYRLHPVQRSAAAALPEIRHWVTAVRAARVRLRQRAAAAAAAALKLNCLRDAAQAELFDELCGEGEA